jgi:hypothetical protein
MEAILEGTITNEMEPALAFLLQQGAAKGLAPEGASFTHKTGPGSLSLEA